VDLLNPEERKMASNWMTSLVLTVALACGCTLNGGVQGWSGDRGVYGFMFENRGSLTEQTDLEVGVEVPLQVQYCPDAHGLDKPCERRPGRIVAVDPRVVNVIDPLLHETGVSGVLDARVRATAVGATEIQVWDSDELIDSFTIHVVKAHLLRFPDGGLRVLPGAYVTRLEYDLERPTILATSTPPWVGATDDVRIEWTQQEEPRGPGVPRVLIRFAVDEGGGKVQAAGGAMSVVTTRATSVVATVVRPPLVTPEPNRPNFGVIEVTAFDELGPIDGSVCQWTFSSSGTTERDEESRYRPWLQATQRYHISATEHGTQRARCQIGEVSAEVAFDVR
jgi:hypothetical protein